jgi:hypothetical protein
MNNIMYPLGYAYNVLNNSGVSLALDYSADTKFILVFLPAAMKSLRYKSKIGIALESPGFHNG